MWSVLDNSCGDADGSKLVMLRVEAALDIGSHSMSKSTSKSGAEGAVGC